MKCILRTPLKTLFDGEVVRISGATEYGIIEIHPGHVALSATIDFSVFEFEHEHVMERFLTKQGFIHTDPDEDKTEILVMTAEKKEEADVKSLKEYREFILEKLKNGDKLGDFQLRHLEESKSAVERMLEVVKEEKGA